jgi:adenylate cyclase
MKHFQFLSIHSIKAKLILIILGIVISIVLALTAAVAYTTANLWNNESKRQLFQNLDQSVSLLENFLEVRENNLEIWRLDHLVESIFQETSDIDENTERLRESFETIREKEPWLVHVFLLHKDKILYDDSDGFEFSDESDGKPSGIQKLRSLPSRGVSVFNISQMDPYEDTNVIVIKRPFLENRVESEDSFMILVLDLDIVNEKLFGDLKIGKHGFITIAAKDYFGGLNVRQPLLTGLEVNEFTEISKSWKSYDDIPEAHGSILIQKKELEEYALAIIGVISVADLEEPVLDLIYLSSFFGVIALLLSIGSAVLYATKLTRPVRALIKKVEQILAEERGLGDQFNATSPFIKYSHQDAEFHKQDELSVLNDTFDVMAEKLSQDTKTLINLTSIFKKFVPYQFLTRVKTGTIDDVALGKGESDFITILFSDIRSFTTYSENMDPEELFQFLNEYLKIMNRQIHKNHGFIDKFIGDAIMALFDEPGKSNDKEAQSAVDAAIGMQNALKKFNHERNKEGLQPINAGIGIHSGQVMIGTIGSETRMDFTVLGDNVNLASRIESLTKQYGAGILISDSTLRLLHNLDQIKHREIDWVKVKGKSEPVELYEIYNTDPPEIQDLKRKAGSSILRGLTQRRRMAWDRAIAAFEKALTIYPGDHAAKYHIKQCQLLRHMDLPDDWDGSIELFEK